MEQETLPMLYTLGHSRHPIDVFVGLLAGQGITRVLDVRGQPYSRFNPQYNREPMARSLDEAGIAYEWWGEHLSGRPKDPALRDSEGNVLWDRARAWPPLHAAVLRLTETLYHDRSCLVCAEENPLGCHRRFLLTPPFEAQGATVHHIRGDGRIETERDLRHVSAGPQLDLFS